MSMVAPPPPRRGRAQAHSRTARLIVATVAAAAAAVTLALVLTGGENERARAERPAGPVERCNGYAELCDRPLNQVAFPGTHNSMAAAELPGWYQPNQRYGIRRQLDDGVRMFMIDTHPGVKRRTGPVVTDLSREDEGKVRRELKGEFGAKAAESFGAISKAEALGGKGKQGEYLCHVICELGSVELSQALGWYRDFLDTHPDEVVILFVEDYVTPSQTAERFRESGILRYAFVHHRDEPFPTLRKLIESDRRLFVLAENDNDAGAFPWYHDGFDLTQETPYTFHSATELADTERSCRPHRGGAHGPFFQLNHWVERIPRSPATASEVNSIDFLLRRALICRQRRGLLPTWVSVDFYNEGDLFEAVRALNDLPRDQKPIYRRTG